MQKDGNRCVTWDKAWRVIGNSIHCALCGVGQSKEKAYAAYLHGDGCAARDNFDQYPWLDLHSIWRELGAAADTKPGDAEDACLTETLSKKPIPSGVCFER